MHHGHPHGRHPPRTMTPRGDFDFMFPELQGDENAFLPTGPNTIAALRQLGEVMTLHPSDVESDIPAVHTYFGQFIDHDVGRVRRR